MNRGRWFIAMVASLLLLYGCFELTRRAVELIFGFNRLSRHYDITRIK